jgi:hypothetical protein
MAQYIDLEKRFTFNINDNPHHLPWKAHNWRQVCRELAGVRGCAPAIHKRNSYNDSNQSLMTDDDRIFCVNSNSKVYVWGVEMYAGGYDTLKIKWRSLASNGPFYQIKGVGAHYKDGSDSYYSNSSWSQDSVSIGRGTSVEYLSQSNGILNYPSQSFDEVSSSPYSIEDERIYFQEVISANNYLGQYGPDDQRLEQAAYTTLSLNNLRAFIFKKEGEYVLEIDESASPWYNEEYDGLYESISDPYLDPYVSSVQSSNFYNPQEPLSYYSSNVFEPISYVSNSYLYGTPQEWINNNTYYFNSFVKNSGNIYRSCFTKKITIKVFNENVDLVNGSIISQKDGVFDPNTLLKNYYIYTPYISLNAYSSSWSNSYNNKNKFFIQLNNSVEKLNYIDMVDSSQRFSKESVRYSYKIDKKLINRRYIKIKGLSILGDSNRANFDESSFIDELSSSSYTWHIDYRGSNFEDCIFSNVDFGSEKNSNIFSGCSFKNCKFYNCVVSIFGDSMLFENCVFSGMANSKTSSSNFDLFSGSSNIFIDCTFEGMNTIFSLNCKDGPICDNLWVRCAFSMNTTHGKDSGLLYFKYENDNKYYFDLNKFSIAESSITGVDDIEWTAKYRCECSRNMFIDNRIYDGVLCSIGSSNVFSRANLFWGNIFYSPVHIDIDANISSKSASMHEVYSYNIFNKLNFKISDNVFHLRFMNNVVNEPHKFSSTGFYGGYKISANIGSAWIGAFGEYVKDDSISPWYCLATYSMGNKIINNKFINWSKEYMDAIPTATKYSNLACSMSVYQNFFLINKSSLNYNQSSLNSDYNNTLLDYLDEYSTPNTEDRIGRFVNVAYKNVFYLPNIQGRLQDPFDGINPNPSSLSFSSPDYINNSVGLCRAVYKKQYKLDEEFPYDSYAHEPYNPYIGLDPYENKQVIFQNFYRIDISIWNSLPEYPPNLV